MDFGSKCVLMRVGVWECRPSGAYTFWVSSPPPWAGVRGIVTLYSVKRLKPKNAQ